MPANFVEIKKVEEKINNFFYKVNSGIIKDKDISRNQEQILDSFIDNIKEIIEYYSFNSYIKM